MGLNSQAFGVVLSLLWSGVAAAGEQTLIQAGWDAPTAAEFRSGVAEFEKWRLFDGTAIVPTRRLTNGSVAVCSPAFSTNHWEWTEFSDCVRDLQAARPQRCTNNFLMLTANPGNVGWFDDDGWTELANHWRVLARAARQGNLAGILFDAEAYQKPFSQFLYAAQADRGEHSFAEFNAKARQRGREVMQAVAEEFPDMTLFAYRLFSDLPRSGNGGNATALLEGSAFGLLAAFIDGWCDALPPTLTLVEGNEAAYAYESEQEFYSAFARLKTGAAEFVSPENRWKLRRQLEVGHGIYLDAFTKTNGAARVMTLVSAALEASDGPVWIYGEAGRWWPKQTNRATWPEKIPGIEAALRGAANPAGFATEFLREKKSENVLRDATFNAATNRAKSWSTWQDAASKGTVILTNNTARLAAADNATVVQVMAVKPGETYAIGALVHAKGRGDAGVAVDWQNSAGKWTARSRRVEFAATGSADGEGWRAVSGIVRVPPEASQLVFLLFARRQGNGGEAQFKEPTLARVDTISGK